MEANFVLQKKYHIIYNYGKFTDKISPKSKNHDPISINIRKYHFLRKKI